LRVAQNPLTVDRFIVDRLPFAFFDWASQKRTTVKKQSGNTDFKQIFRCAGLQNRAVFLPVSGAGSICNTGFAAKRGIDIIRNMECL
jgi:hypothetical protein